MKLQLMLAAADLLDSYSERLGNDGCNDHDWPAGWTDDQKRDFLRGYYYFNSTSTEERGSERDLLLDDLKTLRCPPNFCWASYLAHMLREEP